MVKSILLIVFLLLGFTAVAQQDPVLMCINGKNVLRSEFEYNYNKNNKSAPAPISLNDYVNIFVNLKLKVAAAEAVGIDTTRVFLDKLGKFRRQLAKTYLTDELVTDQEAQRFYDKVKKDSSISQVRVSHIFKYIPQNISGSALRRIELKMDSVFDILKKEGKQAKFATYVKNLSDDKRTLWLSKLQMPVEYEAVVFKMKEGEISAPFMTPQGVYIVKVLEKKTAPLFKEMKDDIIHRQTHYYGVDKGTVMMVEKLKKEYNYTLDKFGWDELLSKGGTVRTLFTLSGKAYTGRDFDRFAAVHPEGIERQLAGFVMKSVLDYENEHLETKYPIFRLKMQKYRDEMLALEMSHREVGLHSAGDEAAIKAYYEKHRSDYHWKEIRYQGIVLHCVTKRIAKQAQKFLKQIPEDEWEDAIRLTFNAGGTPQVQAEKGLFAPGDNAFVDDLIFNQGKAKSVLSFPFAVVLGKKMKGPEDYKEMRESVAADYQNDLEQRWIGRLRINGKVEINQEVLKTVNNH